MAITSTAEFDDMTQLAAKILPLQVTLSKAKVLRRARNKGESKGVVLKGTLTAGFDCITKPYTKISPLRLIWAYSSAG